MFVGVVIISFGNLYYTHSVLIWYVLCVRGSVCVALARPLKTMFGWDLGPGEYIKQDFYLLLFQVIEFVQFKQLEHSNQYLVARVE